MPSTSGIQLTEAIRAGASSTVVIWMTAYGCDGVTANAKRLGVEVCVQKPLEVGEIRRLVLGALGRTDAGGTAEERAHAGSCADAAPSDRKSTSG
jgi:FixJ family two-component response regulator